MSSFQSCGWYRLYGSTDEAFGDEFELLMIETLINYLQIFILVFDECVCVFVCE